MLKSGLREMLVRVSCRSETFFRILAAVSLYRSSAWVV